MKRPYKKRHKKIFPYRFCPYCGDAISKLNKKGVPYLQYAYNALTTCGAKECNGQRWIDTNKANNPPEVLRGVDAFIQFQPIDLFLTRVLK